MKCKECNHNLIWQCDYDAQDTGYAHIDGIVSYHICGNCELMHESIINFTKGIQTLSIVEEFEC